MLVVEFASRGRVIWERGQLTVEPLPSDHPESLEDAVYSLLDMEGVDIRSRGQVRHALLSMAGARIITDTEDDGARGDH